MLDSKGCKATPSNSITLPELIHEKLDSLFEFLYSGAMPAGQAYEAIMEIEQQIPTGANEVGLDNVVVACGSGVTLGGLDINDLDIPITAVQWRPLRLEKDWELLHYHCLLILPQNIRGVYL